MNTDEELGRRFRAAWIAGVNKYFPGPPKPGYIAPWEQMPAWEQQAATAVYRRTAAMVRAGLAQTPAIRLSAEQGGRYVSEAWNVEVFRHIEKPKPNYTSDWDVLPEWQQSTDSDIFAAIEAAVTSEGAP